MSSRSDRTPPEDPSVAPVEEILEAAASRAEGEVPRRNGRMVVTHAVWLSRARRWMTHRSGSSTPLVRMASVGSGSTATSSRHPTSLKRITSQVTTPPPKGYSIGCAAISPIPGVVAATSLKPISSTTSCCEESVASSISARPRGSRHGRAEPRQRHGRAEPRQRHGRAEPRQRHDRTVRAAGSPVCARS